MTFDKQDLLLKLRKLATDTDTEGAHLEADDALIRFIDDEHVTEAWNAIAKWYA